MNYIDDSVTSRDTESCPIAPTCGHRTDTGRAFMAERITSKLIEMLQAPESGNSILYDKDVRGFGVRVTTNGVTSFILNYRINGRERRYTIGRCDEWSVTA